MNKFLDTISVIGAMAMAATPLLAMGGVAHAAESRTAGTRVVVGDLDLSRAPDVVRFRHRVDIAAEAFCGQTNIGDLTAMSACRQAVQEEAVAKLGASQRQDLQAAEAGPMAVRLATR